MKNNAKYAKRGAAINSSNPFLKQHYNWDENLADEQTDLLATKTIYLQEVAKTLVHKVKSPDVGMLYSMNPYQGCAHGCVYCYARNTHEYWGYSAGIDFEQKVIVKENANDLLVDFLNKPGWDATPISLSGNTDCYQPAEQKFGITRQLISTCNSYNQPIGIITKNAAILNDIDLLAEMASKKLVSVMVSITSLDEDLRRKMEPRTTTASQRLNIIEALSDAGVPCGVMAAPIIPGLNDNELYNILHAAQQAGAVNAGYTFVRLNGSVKIIFHNWLYNQFPDKADKVWNLITTGHGGQVSDSRFGTRMRGEGVFADLINQQFKKYRSALHFNSNYFKPDTSIFCRPTRQLRLFL